MKKTSWPDAPPRLRTILDTWEDIGRAHIGRDIQFSYTKKQKKALMNSANELASSYASLQIAEIDWPRVMWWTYRYMEANDLTVGTHPMGMAFGGKKWLHATKKQGSQTDRRRYLEGL